MISDREVIDHLLGEKGTSREALEAQILEQKKKDLEAKKAAEKAEALRQEQLREKAKDDRIRASYDGLFRVSIDGNVLNDVSEPRNIPCPYCSGPLEFLRPLMDAMIAPYYEAMALYDNNITDGTGWSTVMWQTYRKERSCPHCGAKMQIVMGIISPEVRELFVEAKAKKGRQR